MNTGQSIVAVSWGTILNMHIIKWWPTASVMSPNLITNSLSINSKSHAPSSNFRFLHQKMHIGMMGLIAQIEPKLIQKWSYWLFKGVIIWSFFFSILWSFSNGRELCERSSVQTCTQSGWKQTDITQFLRYFTKSDAKNMTMLHKNQHGVKGMAGCLDCMHIQWENCPYSLCTHHVPNEGFPMLVLEASCDYNQFFWHHEFGHAG